MATNLERFKKDLDALIKLGANLDLSADMPSIFEVKLKRSPVMW